MAKIRIQNAKSTLKKPNMTVKEISYVLDHREISNKFIDLSEKYNSLCIKHKKYKYLLISSIILNVLTIGYVLFNN